MKTLVIHPKDETTDVLAVIYADKDWTVITDPFLSKNKLKKEIINHDRIIMLGHGSPAGLFGGSRFVIDSTFVYLLRDKDCVCVWCHANEFVEKYGLTGFYTGMIISEVSEAKVYNVETTQAEVTASNILFSNSVRDYLDSPNIVSEIREVYKSNVNEVIKYNHENLFYGIEGEPMKCGVCSEDFYGKDYHVFDENYNIEDGIHKCVGCFKEEMMSQIKEK